jgi:hypothetical protein
MLFAEGCSEVFEFVSAGCMYLPNTPPLKRVGEVEWGVQRGTQGRCGEVQQSGGSDTGELWGDTPGEVLPGK